LKPALFALAACGVCAFAAAPLDPVDLWGWRSASDARISPDGSRVVYVESWNDRARDARWTNLVLVAADGGLRRLTSGARRDRCPRWSPDGALIAWIAVGEAGPARIAILALAADGAEREIVVPGGEPLALAWSPENDQLAFTARVSEDGARPEWAPAAIQPFLRSAAGSRTELFAMAASGGAARRLAPGFACQGEPAWLTDGRGVVVAGSEGGIYVVPLKEGAPRRLDPGGAACDSPAASPDGQKIAWVAADRRQAHYATRKIWVANTDGTRARVLSGALDRDAAHPQWSSDSRTIYFLAVDRGATHVYAARNDGTVRQATSANERLRGFSLAENGRAAAVRSAADEPESVVVFSVYGGEPARPLVRLNAELAARATGAVEEVRYQSAGRAIQAWLVKPPGFSAARKYPLLLDIADPAHGAYGYEFPWRAHLAAARGFVVLLANPRGSPGYGEEFGAPLETGFPADPFDDLMRGVDFAAAQPYIDPRRLTVSGGVLAAWAIGHTDRFAAAVVRGAAVDPSLAASFLAGNFRTPALLIAGSPDTLSEALLLALEARKVDTALLRLPRPLTPGRGILELETWLAWLAR
jgi:acylaminoacyl-peptidase